MQVWVEWMLVGGVLVGSAWAIFADIRDIREADRAAKRNACPTTDPEGKR